MTKVLVLYYSSYGHIETMAKAIAEGAAAVPGVEVAVKRVPETVPAAIAAAGVVPGTRLAAPYKIGTIIARPAPTSPHPMIATTG